MRETFAVGRVGKKSREVMWTRGGARRDPFPGPWSVRAVVGPREPDAPVTLPEPPADPEPRVEPAPAPTPAAAPATPDDGRPQLDLFV